MQTPGGPAISRATSFDTLPQKLQRSEPVGGPLLDPELWFESDISDNSLQELSPTGFKVSMT
jgi:hypothetical protein